MKNSPKLVLNPKNGHWELFSDDKKIYAHTSLFMVEAAFKSLYLEQQLTVKV